MARHFRPPGRLMFLRPVKGARAESAARRAFEAVWIDAEVRAASTPMNHGIGGPDASPQLAHPIYAAASLGAASSAAWLGAHGPSSAGPGGPALLCAGRPSVTRWGALASAPARAPARLCARAGGGSALQCVKACRTLAARRRAAPELGRARAARRGAAQELVTEGMLVSPRMMADHLPDRLCKVLRRLARARGRQRDGGGGLPSPVAGAPEDSDASDDDAAAAAGPGVAGEACDRGAGAQQGAPGAAARGPPARRAS